MAPRKRTRLRRIGPKPEGKKPKKQWTVMLYMAATVDDQPVEPTEQAAINDLRELEKVGSTSAVDVVVQVHRRWPRYAERYLVKKGFSEMRESFPDFAELSKGGLHLLKTIPCVGDPKGLYALTGTKEGQELVDKLDAKDPEVLRKFFGTGNPAVLKNFVDWAQASYPAKHYLLVLWGHAYGLGFGRDNHDPLTIPELGQALKNLRLDILGANACAMSYAEAAFELGVNHAAKFMVASEITMPFQGWPYEKILNRIPNRGIQPKDLGKAIIDDFMDSFGGKGGVSLTMLDLSKASALDDLATRIADLAGPLNAAIEDRQPPDPKLSDEVAAARITEELQRDGPADQVDEKVKRLAVKLNEAKSSALKEAKLFKASSAGHPPNGASQPIGTLRLAFDQAVRERAARQVRFAFQDTAHSADVRPLIDLADLCDRLKRLLKSRDNTIERAAESLRDILERGNGLLVEHRRDANLDGLNGLGIYAPAITNAADLERLELDDKESYKRLALFARKDNKWKELVYKGLQQLLEPTRTDIANFVNGTGTASPEDAAAVGQLTAGVFRAFEKLELALASTLLTVLGDEGLNGNSGSGAPAFKSALTDIPFELSPAARGQLAARMAPPFLRLVGPFSVNGNGYPKMGARKKSIPKRINPLIDNVVRSLRSFEDALAYAETTTVKALTHARFGVGGPPKPGGGEGPPKPSGEGPPKPSGEGPPKPSGEGPPKPSGEGLFPPILASLIDVGDLRGAGEMKSVIGLYGQVALSLQRLERCAEKLEGVLRAALTNAGLGINLDDPDGAERYREYTTELVKQSFGELDQTLTDARRITVEVVEHPVFGLGPGPVPGLGESGRQRLAGAAGLGPQTLRLLLGGVGGR